MIINTIIKKIIKLVIIATFLIFFSFIFVPKLTAILLLTIKLQAAYRIVEIVKNAKFEMSNENVKSECGEAVNENEQTKIVEIIIIGTNILFIVISHFKSLDIINKLKRIIKIDHKWNFEL